MNHSARQTALHQQPDATLSGEALWVPLCEEAAAFIPADRVPGLLREWLPSGERHGRGSEEGRHPGFAIFLAKELALSMPSLLGVTAFDRLARAGGRRSPQEAEMLTALRRSRYRVLGHQRGQWIDRVTGEPVPLARPVPDELIEGIEFICRSAPLADGSIVVAGFPVPLDRDAMEVVGGFMKPGARGLSNPTRCAEAVFRHILRNGMDPAIVQRLAVNFDATDGSASGPAKSGDGPLGSPPAKPFGNSPGKPSAHPSGHPSGQPFGHTPGNASARSSGNASGNPPGGSAGKPRLLPFEPPMQPLDIFAARWAERGGELDEADKARAREMTSPTALLTALVHGTVARDAERTRLADTYARIALVMIETIVIRGLHGSGGLSLDGLADYLAGEVAHRGLTPRITALFQSLRARVKLSAGSSRTSDGELDRLVTRIRGLREKTVEQGCTEQEALAAAEKVAELLDKYGLSLNELDLRQQNCEGVGIETGRKRRGPIDDCMTTIASFFDCRVWAETSLNGTLRYVFFGMPGDVQAAVYLHDLIAMAFETETQSFQAGAIYRETLSGQRRTATNSFQIGLSRGIIAKLTVLSEARTVRQQGTGRDLVPIKESIIETELEKLGLQFHRRGGSSRRSVLSDAFNAGKEAGERFDYRPGLEQGGA